MAGIRLKRSGKLISSRMNNGWQQWLRDELPNHYRPSRFKARGSDYMSSVISAHEKRMEMFGCTSLSHHDEITGRGVTLYIDRTVVLADIEDRGQHSQNLTHILG